MSRKDERAAKIGTAFEPPAPKRNYHAVDRWLGETADEAVARYGADRIGESDVVFIIQRTSVGRDGVERPGPRERAARLSGPGVGLDLDAMIVDTEPHGK